MIEQKLGAAGLYLDPSELSDAPRSALRAATNVVIRKPGIIEPRAPLQVDEGAFTDVAAPIVALHTWRGAVYAVQHAAGLHRKDAGEITDEDGGTLQISSFAPHAADLAGSLFVSCFNEVRRIDSATATTAPPAGVPAPRGLAVGQQASGTAFVGDDGAAYRATISRRVNGRLLVSVPTWPVQLAIASTLGGTYDGAVTALLPPAGVQGGDRLEVYRTAVVTGDEGRGDAGDEMAFVAGVEITAADITAGQVTVVDDAADPPVGAALYTNATQQGILQANDPPPACADLASYAGMMFYAAAQRATHQLEATLTRDPGVRVGYDGWLLQNVSGTCTSGSPTFTVSAAGGLTGAEIAARFEVGMVTSESSFGEPFGFDAAVIGVAGSVVTFDANATLSGTQTVTVGHWIEVNGVRYTCATGTGGGGASFFSNGNTIAAFCYEVNSGQFAVDAISTATATGFPGGLVLRSADPITVRASADDLFDAIGTSLTTSSVSETPQNRLAFSKVDEPDAVPATNFVQIGSRFDPIVRAVESRDSLFVFKTDGVWRVTGSSPETLRVDEFDRGLRLVDGRCVTTLEGAVYAVTNRGAVRITSAGVAVLSGGVVGEAFEQPQRWAEQELLLNLPYYFASADPADRSVLFGVPDGQFATAGRIFVFNLTTGAWTAWRIDTGVYSAAWDGPSGKLVFGCEASTYREYTPGGSSDFSDTAPVLSSIDTAGNTIVLDDGGLPPGTMIFGAGGLRCFLTSAGVALGGGLFRYDVDDASGIAIAPVGARRGIDCAVEWSDFTGGAPSQTKHFRETHLHFRKAPSATVVNVEWSSDGAGAGDPARTSATASGVRRDLRYGVARANAHSSRLRPTMRIRQPAQDWELEGASVVFEPMSGGERQA